jgi:hypothetical protein
MGEKGGGVCLQDEMGGGKWAKAGGKIHFKIREIIGGERKQKKGTLLKEVVGLWNKSIENAALKGQIRHKV